MTIMIQFDQGSHICVGSSANRDKQIKSAGRPTQAAEHTRTTLFVDTSGTEANLTHFTVKTAVKAELQNEGVVSLGLETLTHPTC